MQRNPKIKAFHWKGCAYCDVLGEILNTATTRVKCTMRQPQSPQSLERTLVGGGVSQCESAMLMLPQRWTRMTTYQALAQLVGRNIASQPSVPGRAWCSRSRTKEIEISGVFQDKTLGRQVEVSLAMANSYKEAHEATHSVTYTWLGTVLTYLSVWRGMMTTNTCSRTIENSRIVRPINKPLSIWANLGESSGWMHWNDLLLI